MLNNLAGFLDGQPEALDISSSVTIPGNAVFQEQVNSSTQLVRGGPISTVEIGTDGVTNEQLETTVEAGECFDNTDTNLIGPTIETVPCL